MVYIAGIILVRIDQIIQNKTIMFNTKKYIISYIYLNIQSLKMYGSNHVIYLIMGYMESAREGVTTTHGCFAVLCSCNYDTCVYDDIRAVRKLCFYNCHVIARTRCLWLALARSLSPRFGFSCDTMFAHT